MKNKIYIVDAFTNEVFKGNPAGVCPLEAWPSDLILQNIAMENNLSETAFFVKEENGYRLRWFTPEYEIELCGHGTLAAAYVIFNYYEKDINEILFNTLSGELKVNRDENKIIMDFPLLEGKRKEIDDRVFEALGVIPIDAYEARDLMLVLRDEEDVLYLQPNMDILKSLGYDGIMVTAKGRDCDFVCLIV
ncbi:PhzF family phenazine biosynthesis protein [Clostridium paraputrificum]|uniref:PhzF family phenazine biosynthesis protein n=1 Tax=Clostridium paraputrificum TaxID=29363 RepID=UPI002FE4B5A0